jgi:hypothetical protein
MSVLRSFRLRLLLSFVRRAEVFSPWGFDTVMMELDPDANSTDKRPHLPFDLDLVDWRVPRIR